MTLSSTSAGVPARTAQRSDQVAPDVTLQTLPGRVLTRPELLALAATVARSPQLWEHAITSDGGEREYACLHRDEEVDVWVLRWTTVGDTGWHDHDVSAGAVAVARGRVIESNLAIGATEVVTEVEAGRVYAFGPEHIHRMRGAAPVSISVHAYSPPLARLGQYTVDADGVLRRTTVSYTEELRVPEVLA